jgi:hypothetical protein
LHEGEHRGDPAQVELVDGAVEHEEDEDDEEEEELQAGNLVQVYLAVEQQGVSSRHWLDDVEELDELQLCPCVGDIS